MASIAKSLSNPLRKLSNNVASLLVIQVSNYALPLISVPYFTRIVGPEKFGVINFIGAFVAYCMLVTEFGFDTTATRDVVHAKENPRQLNQLCSEVFYSKAILFVLSLSVYSLFIACLPQLREELFVSLSYVFICFAIVLTPSWLFQGFQDNHVLAYYNITSKVLFTVAVLVFINVEQDYILYPLLLSMSQILIGGVAFYRIRSKYHVRLVSVSFHQILNRIKSSKHIFISMLVISLYSTTNVIIIGFFKGEGAVGQLSAALKIMALVQACLSVPFTQALFPFIGQRFKDSREEGFKVVQVALPIVLIIGLVCCLACCILAPLLVDILFGAEFRDAVHMLRILAFIPLVVVFSQFLGIQIMINLNMDRTFKKVILYGAIGGLIMNTLGGYFGGAIGISGTYLFTELTIAFFFIHFLRKENIALSTLFAKLNMKSLRLLINNVRA